MQNLTTLTNAINDLRERLNAGDWAAYRRALTAVARDLNISADGLAMLTEDQSALSLLQRA